MLHLVLSGLYHAALRVVLLCAFSTKTLTTFLDKGILSILRFPLDTRRCGALLFRARRGATSCSVE